MHPIHGLKSLLINLKTASVQAQRDETEALLVTAEEQIRGLDRIFGASPESDSEDKEKDRILYEQILENMDRLRDDLVKASEPNAG